MKKFFVILISLITIFLFLMVFCFFWWKNQLSPVAPGNSQPISFVIPKNQNNNQTIFDLYSKHLIKSSLVAKIYLRLNYLDKKILPGSYVISQAMTLPEIFSTISAGPKDIWVTLPEGWRREQMAVRLAGLIGDSFDPLEFIRQTASLEGTLFPDTYLIPESASAGDVINILIQNFTKKSGIDLQNLYSISLDGKQYSYSGSDVVILASLVERETKVTSDRPLVAGILLRRLNIGMPLQIDASLQYASATTRCFSRLLDCDYWQPILDTKVPSLYNTYLHPGLPPSPIANPGLASLTAVLSPQSSTYLYYLTGNDGVTYYATTLSQHNLNIDTHLKN